MVLVNKAPYTMLKKRKILGIITTRMNRKIYVPILDITHRYVWYVFFPENASFFKCWKILLTLWVELLELFPLYSDVFEEQKSGSGQVRGLLWGFRSGLGINISGTSPPPPGFSKLKSKVGVGSGSTFHGWVGFGDHNVGVVPLGFWGFESVNTSLVPL